MELDPGQGLNYFRTNHTYDNLNGFGLENNMAGQRRGA